MGSGYPSSPLYDVIVDEIVAGGGLVLRIPESTQVRLEDGAVAYPSSAAVGGG